MRYYMDYPPPRQQEMVYDPNAGCFYYKGACPHCGKDSVFKVREEGVSCTCSYCGHTDKGYFDRPIVNRINHSGDLQIAGPIAAASFATVMVVIVIVFVL